MKITLRLAVCTASLFVAFPLLAQNNSDHSGHDSDGNSAGHRRIASWIRWHCRPFHAGPNGRCLKCSGVRNLSTQVSVTHDFERRDHSRCSASEHLRSHDFRRGAVNLRRPIVHSSFHGRTASQCNRAGARKKLQRAPLESRGAADSSRDLTMTSPRRLRLRSSRTTRRVSDAAGRACTTHGGCSRRELTVD